MIFDRHANLKYKYGNRHFWCRGYYVDTRKNLSKHSFVVLKDEAGRIQGLDYNLICNVMSSFKNKEQREKKLKYPGNFPITHNDSSIYNHGNEKDGDIKAEQFYYFNKNTIDFIVIGSMNIEAFNLLIEFIQELEIPIDHIVDNV